MLYNPVLYPRAYARFRYSNKGAMTKGTTGETVDGMSLAKIEHLIQMSCVMNGISGRLYYVSTSPRKRAGKDRLDYPRGRISCCKK